YTVANRTQGIMEKSQWDLKKIRFQRRRLTRLDDFVDVYQQMHDAVIREYRDVEKSRKKVSINLPLKKFFIITLVDAVVNAANKELQHCGGLALAISEAGGPKIQAECDDYIAKNGPLKTGEAVVCSAGNLPCKKIIHVVGPNLRTKPTGKAVAQARPLLRRAILSVLEMAEENMLSSIAIPAISSGIFNFPTQTCVDIIVKTIHDHVMQKTARSPPFEICLIDKNNITAKEMERACKKLLCDALSNVKKKVNLKKEHPTETSKSQLKVIHYLLT
uniref:Macro domain-containing protein n=1 Tax=Amphilophus citrinellus TaxID=61819 RepID=A0A3Q0R841_AMPCI